MRWSIRDKKRSRKADFAPSPPLATSAKDGKAQREDEVKNSREKAQKTQKREISLVCPRSLVPVQNCCSRITICFQIFFCDVCAFLRLFSDSGFTFASLREISGSIRILPNGSAIPHLDLFDGVDPRERVQYCCLHPPWFVPG